MDVLFKSDMIVQQRLMRAIIFITAAAALLYAVECSSNAAEWYETLRPGVTRSEILKLAGDPSGSDGKVDTYAQIKGRIQCAYDGATLWSVIYYDPPGGAVSWTLYKMDGELKDSDLALRKTYLKTGDFKIMPEFSGRKVYTHKYGCDCYEVDGGFIVVEPIIGLGGGMGFFEDKAARVLWLKSDGAEKVLYRAADHWEALKPTGLLGQEIKNREMKLKEAGEEIVCPRWVSQTLLERAIQSWVPAYFTGSTTSTMAWPSSLVFLPTEHSNT